MNREEIRDLAAVYALGGLPEEDRARFEALLQAGDADAAAALREFEDTLVTVAAQWAQAPPPSAKAALMARIDAEVHAPRSIAAGKPARSRRVFWPALWAAAMAAGIKVVLVDTTLSDPSGAVSQISSDNTAGGGYAFRAIQQLVPGGGEVLVVNVKPGVSTTDQRQAGFDVVLPTDPDLGQPDASYLNGQRVGLIWATRPGLPSTESPGVGLVISEFRGNVDERYFEKILGPDTTLTRVTVGGSPGYWISGAPHFFFYIDPTGQAVNDDHPTVGDVLLWTNGDVTYRLETSLGMAAAIRLTPSLMVSSPVAYESRI